MRHRSHDRPRPHHRRRAAHASYKLRSQRSAGETERGVTESGSFYTLFPENLTVTSFRFLSGGQMTGHSGIFRACHRRPSPESPKINRPSTRSTVQLISRNLGDYLFGLSDDESVESAATKASCGTSTRPMVFIRFLPSFFFSSSLRLREMSPP